MSLWRIAWNSLKYRRLSSALTAFSMALGVALVVVVLVIYATIRSSFARGSEGFHLVVGPKAGRLELVLNAIFHLGTPPGKIPYSYYKEFLPGGKFANYVSTAVPICLGDNYEGFRVIGTSVDFFPAGTLPGKPYVLATGRAFEPQGYFEAVVGSQVARRTGLKVGSAFEPTHGLAHDEIGHKHDAFKVVGVLAPTGTRSDYALFVNIEGFYLLDGHAEAPPAGAPKRAKGEPLPEDQRAVSAVLVRCKMDAFGQALQRAVFDGPVAQAVFPTREVKLLFETLIAPMLFILLALAVLVVIVASVGLMVSIYNSMAERRRDIAIMRSLGAGRRTVLTVVLLESLLLAAVGGLCGWALGHGLIGLLSPVIENYTGVSIHFWESPQLGVLLDPSTRSRLGDTLVHTPIELLLLPVIIVAAGLAGLLPAVTAYRTDVAKTLSS
ncbi:MAG: ABC transporter permease [Planctomycetes bacterium]|nr:ABC transporter permease [Planctomycetota bacterium]